MNDKLYQAFDSIKAEESLKENTLLFLEKEAGRNSAPVIHSFHRYAALATSLLFLLFAGGFSSYLYFNPVTYIDVDVNPSIGLSANQFGRIINAYAYNPDGEELLSSVDIKYHTYEDALSLLMKEMEQEHYLTNDGLLSITVQSDNDAEGLLKQMKQSVETVLDDRHLTTKQELFVVDSKTWNSAHNLNLSPAKYLAILDLQKVDPTANMEDCKHHSISELKAYTQQHGHEKNACKQNGSAGCNGYAMPDNGSIQNNSSENNSAANNSNENSTNNTTNNGHNSQHGHHGH